MVQALQLIILSLQLLLLAHNPLLPADVRDKATTLGNFAMEVGNKALQGATADSVASSVATSTQAAATPLVASSTAYIPVAPVVLGAVTPPAPVPAPEVDKSEIMVEQLPATVGNVSAFETAYGIKRVDYNFKVSVLDKNGKKQNTQVVMSGSVLSDDQVNVQGGVCGIMTSPSNFPSFGIIENGHLIGCPKKTDQTEWTKGTTVVSSAPLADSWYATFNYVPTTLGTKTATFTSGSLSKTITFDVVQ